MKHALLAFTLAQLYEFKWCYRMILKHPTFFAFLQIMQFQVNIGKKEND
jgi:hypothetical protein